jgi:hypothetical protein
MSLSLSLHFVCERDLQMQGCDGMFIMKERILYENTANNLSPHNNVLFVVVV